MSSRRTRAHPSPGGFRQLEDQPRKRSTRTKSKKSAESIITAAESSLHAPAEAPAVEAAAAAPLHRQSPPTATSRSQSENDNDVESDSQHVPESRSTSPPSSSNPQPSTSRSISPPSFAPFTNPFKAAKRSPNPSATAKSRAQLNKKNSSTTSPGRKNNNTTKAPVNNVLGKHGRTEDEEVSSTNQGADAVDTEESRPAKRTRNERKMEPQYHYNSDSSFDMEELERNPGPQPSKLKKKPVKKMTQKAKAAQEKRMKNLNNSSDLIIPATETEEKIVLKRPDIIDATRSLAKWAERDHSNPVPNAEQLEALLESFKAQELAKAAAMQETGEDQPIGETVLEDTPPRHRDEAPQRDQDQGSILLTSNPNIREVEDELDEHQSPTRAKTPEPQESRLWNTVSKVTSLVTSPFKLMGRRGQDAADGIPAANTPSETLAQLPLEPLYHIPTTTPTRPRKRRLPGTPSSRRAKPLADAELPDTAKAITRNVWPQPERKRRPLPEYMRPPPPKNVFFHKDPKNEVPIELVGVVSAERIKEIQDKQDQEAEDRLAKARQESRQARVEDEEASADKEHEVQPETLAQAGQRTGEKRKRRPVRSPSPQTPGVFTVPYESSSEGDSSYMADSPVDIADNSSAPTLPFTNFKAPDEAPKEAPKAAPEVRSEPEPFNIFKNRKRVVLPWEKEPLTGFQELFNPLLGLPVPGREKPSDTEAVPLTSSDAEPHIPGSFNTSPQVEEVASSSSSSTGPTNWGNQVSSASSMSSSASAPSQNKLPSSSSNLWGEPKSAAGSNAFLSAPKLPASPSKAAPPLPYAPVPMASTRWWEPKSAADTLSSENLLRPSPWSAPLSEQGLPPPLAANRWWEQVASASPHDTRSSQNMHGPSVSSTLFPSQGTPSASNRESEQTPPAKPRPVNAQLPPQPSAIALANAQKYLPKHPSKLRNMTKMSPLHAEGDKENEGTMAHRFAFRGFDPEVLRVVNNLPDSFFEFT